LDITEYLNSGRLLATGRGAKIWYRGTTQYLLTK